MNEQGASHFSHKKPPRVGRARKRSSWWRLAGKRIAGRSGRLCIIDEARCPSGGPFSLLLRAPSSVPRSPCLGLGVGAGAAARASQPRSAADTMGRGRQSPAGGRSGELGVAVLLPQPLLLIGGGCGAAGAACAQRPRAATSRGPCAGRTAGVLGYPFRGHCAIRQTG